MPTPNCPKCKSENVKSSTLWRIAVSTHYLTEPAVPMFACQEPTCLHKWARSSDAKACEHTTQRLIELTDSDSSSPMGRYACAECGAEIIRP